MNLRFGYNTNGFAHHRLHDALVVIAGCGYDGVALSVDVQHCDPFHITPAELRHLQGMFKALQLSVVVETGARYLLSKWFKHEPTLISRQREGRELRMQFLKRAVNLAAELGAEAVSFWSGPLAKDVTGDEAWEWLAAGCREIAEYAEQHGVALAFEPEPGMMVDTLPAFERLKAQVPSPAFGLTLDIGHVFCSEPERFEAIVRQHAPVLRNVHIEDIKGRVHEHRMFGEGDIVFPPVLRALGAAGYKGLINVELSRDSHRAPDVARRSIELLRQWSAQAQASATH
jgi:L-ribulose-5-phosphate 3-epimerase